MERKMRLFHENFGGNLHEVSEIINKHCPEIIPGIIVMDYGTNYTVVVYRAKKQHPFFVRKPIDPKDSFIGLGLPPLDSIRSNDPESDGFG
jgi:hypothetical protein